MDSSREETAVAIDLTGLPFDLGALPFAGSIRLQGVATAEFEDQVRHIVESTPTAYFHPSNQDILVYDELSLRQRFSAGDYSGRERSQAGIDEVVLRGVFHEPMQLAADGSLIPEDAPAGLRKAQVTP